MGSGELETYLQKTAVQLGIEDRVIFTGFREDIPEILSILDLFVMPSLLEGLCTSLMDALYMKVPVVATTAGGIPEVIEHDTTGLLIPPRNPLALAEAIVQLLNDEKKRKFFAKEGRKKVIDQFTVTQMVEKTEKIYKKLRGNIQK